MKPRAIEVSTHWNPRAVAFTAASLDTSTGSNADLAIAIRTAVISHGRASVQAGAGIVADSVFF